MDIAFHYFAVKALAVSAGFSEKDAQFIAEYSQMVDDFDYYSLWFCNNVPDYVKQDGFDISDGNIGSVHALNPVQTGFLADGHIINFDYIHFLSNRFQRLTCAPFHFIYLNKKDIDKTDYRVYPAVMGDMSLIWFMMKTAHDEYRAALDGAIGIYGTNDTFKRKTLMKIGLLLHIFADTTAHQMFSGFNDNVNEVELLRVINNNTNRDETEKYKSMIVEFLKTFKSIVPKIGHMMIEHVPDLTHLSFEMICRNGTHYTRSNTADFITCGKEIFRFLSWCCNETTNLEDKWIDIQNKLGRCFLTDISECSDEKSMVNLLKPVWAREFEDVKCFDFDLEKIRNGYELKKTALTNDIIMQVQNIPEEYRNSVITTASQDFYLFNVCAEEVLVNLYGNNPRRLIGDELLYPTTPINKE